jgi:hypothetical protein
MAPSKDEKKAKKAAAKQARAAAAAAEKAARGPDAPAAALIQPVINSTAAPRDRFDDLTGDAFNQTGNPQMTHVSAITPASPLLAATPTATTTTTTTGTATGGKQQANHAQLARRVEICDWRPAFKYPCLTRGDIGAIVGVGGTVLCAVCYGLVRCYCSSRSRRAAADRAVPLQQWPRSRP